MSHSRKASRFQCFTRHATLESLEPRCLLSAAALTSGSRSLESNAAIVAAATVSGPTISSVAAVPLKGTISWNAYDADGVKSSSVKIDGTKVSKLYGPLTADSGVNYYANFGAISVGVHKYTITATDEAGNVSTKTGTFTVVKSGPTISSVVAVPLKGTISWNAYDINGVKSSSLKIDGTKVSKLYGPFTADSGVNYYANFGAISVGVHKYTITATDKAGNVSTKTGTFTVVKSGPTISSVAVSVSDGIISWNAYDINGVKSSSLKIDGSAVSSIGGPYAATSGVNYSGSFDGYSLSVGTHSYKITATDKAGNVSTKTGTFSVSATSSGRLAAVDTAFAATVEWNKRDE
jgi:hypothetical protein